MKRAFSLVELLVMISVLAIGFGTILLVLRGANADNAGAHFVTVAGKLAQGRLEEIAADRRTRGFAYIDNANYPDEDPVPNFKGYQRMVNIYYVDLNNLDRAVASSNYKRVDVTIESVFNITVFDFPTVTVWTIVSNY